MKSRFILTLLFFVSCGAIAQEATTPRDGDPDAYRAAAESARTDLEKALADLAALRGRIAEEKPALAKETSETAAALREARRKADLARVTRDAAEDEFEKAESDLQAWRDEKLYLESLFIDFAKTKMATASPARFDPTMALPAITDTAASLDLIDDALAQLENAGQVATIAGAAAVEDGIMAEGEFAELGPLTWFVSADGASSGAVVSGDDLRPMLVAGTASAKEIKDLLAGNEGSPAFDPTGGDAIAMEETETGLIDHFRMGGFWIYPILLLALVALIAAIAKWIQLMRLGRFSSSQLGEILRLDASGESHGALALTREIRHPAARVLERGITANSSKGTTRDDVEEAMFETFLEAQQPLQRGLPLVAIASATAPLLGLLGTVTGMIETFRLINIFGTGDAKSLASGISEALVTTEFGLVVAIPALILHALLSRRVQGIKATMEMASLAYLNGMRSPDDPGPTTAVEQKVVA